MPVSDPAGHAERVARDRSFVSERSPSIGALRRSSGMPSERPHAVVSECSPSIGALRRSSGMPSERPQPPVRGTDGCWSWIRFPRNRWTGCSYVCQAAMGAASSRRNRWRATYRLGQRTASRVLFPCPTRRWM